MTRVLGLRLDEHVSEPTPIQAPLSASETAPSLLEWGVVLRALEGYEESGDQYLVKPFSSGVLVAAVDGLGHGDKAAVAAKAAVAVLERHAHESVDLLVKRCHQELVGSRGVVMSLASFNAPKGTMTWLGVGNVQGLLLHAPSERQGFSGKHTHAKHPPVSERTVPGRTVDDDANLIRQSLLLRGGTVGYRLPTLRATIHPLTPGDILVFVSDGVRSGFARGLDLMASPQAIAEQIYEQYARGTDDTLVLVARYMGN
ncbi:MAG: SpoIIE family protein phosphatase [Anaerolineae bacterium]|nr:SpoIIE family protein phosphatase [Anaerolineae bacterium]